MNVGDLVIIVGQDSPIKGKSGIIVGHPKKFTLSGYAYPILIEENIVWVFPEQIKTIQKAKKKEY